MDLASFKNPAEIQLALDFRNLILTKKFPLTLVRSSNYVFFKLIINIVVDIAESQGFGKENLDNLSDKSMEAGEHLSLTFNLFSHSQSCK